MTITPKLDALDPVALEAARIAYGRNSSHDASSPGLPAAITAYLAALPAKDRGLVELDEYRALAYAVVDWRHEWNDATLDPEFITTLDALEKLLGDWAP